MSSTSLHDVLPNGLTSARCGTFCPTRVKSASVSLTLASVRDRQQVQHRVGRPAERHHDGDRVLERLLGEDVAGGDAAAQHLDDGLPAAAGVLVAARVDGRRRSAARQRHAHCLGGRRHGVGGVHAAARALAGTDRTLDDVDVLARHQAAGAGADGLERVDDRDFLLAAVGELRDARHDRAVVEEDARQVQTRGGHQHARDRLVATGEQHRSVEALGLHDRLDAVGDDLARHQREVHALVAHRDAVGHRDGAEFQRVAAGRECTPSLTDCASRSQRHVARGDLVPRRADADLRLGPVVVTHADRAQHAAGGGLLEAVGDVAAARLDVGVVDEPLARRASDVGCEGMREVCLRRFSRTNSFIYPTGVCGSVMLMSSRITRIAAVCLPSSSASSPPCSSPRVRGPMTTPTHTRRTNPSARRSPPASTRTTTRLRPT